MPQQDIAIESALRVSRNPGEAMSLAVFTGKLVINVSLNMGGTTSLWS